MVQTANYMRLLTVAVYLNTTLIYGKKERQYHLFIYCYFRAKLLRINEAGRSVERLGNHIKPENNQAANWQ